MGEFILTLADTLVRLVVIGIGVLHVLAFYRTRRTGRRHTWRTVLFRDDDS